MTILYRCDICHGLIDPVEGDERAVLESRIRYNGDVEDYDLDLCEDCKPESLGSHVDWMVHHMVNDT